MTVDRKSILDAVENPNAPANHGGDLKGSQGGVHGFSVASLHGHSKNDGNDDKLNDEKAIEGGDNKFGEFLNACSRHLQLRRAHSISPLEKNSLSSFYDVIAFRAFLGSAGGFLLGLLASYFVVVSAVAMDSVLMQVCRTAVAVSH